MTDSEPVDRYERCRALGPSRRGTSGIQHCVACGESRHRPRRCAVAQTRVVRREGTGRRYFYANLHYAERQLPPTRSIRRCTSTSHTGTFCVVTARRHGGKRR